MTTTQPEVYVPGRCNLGATEIRRRYRNGYLGLAIAIAVMIIIQLTEAYHLKWIFFFPIFYSLSGFIQARSKFCYWYGMQKVFSMTGRKILSKVTEDESIRKDRQTAWRIVLLAFAGSSLLTWVYYQLPF
jgi:hypothetical protein